MGTQPYKMTNERLSNNQDKSIKISKKEVKKIDKEVQKTLKKIKNKKTHKWKVHHTKIFFITIIFLLIVGLFFTQYFWFWINSLDSFQSSSVLPERKFLLNSCNIKGFFTCEADVFGDEILLSIGSGGFALQNATLSACQGHILKSNNLIKLYGCYISPYSNNFVINVKYLKPDSNLPHNMRVNVMKQREISWGFNILPDK